MQSSNGFNFRIIVAKNAIPAVSRNIGEKEEISETTEVVLKKKPKETVFSEMRNHFEFLNEREET